MSEAEVDLRHFLGVFWRQRAVIAAVTATLVALAAVWSLTRAPRYEATATVLVDLRAITGQQFGGGQAAATAASEQALRTEIEVLTGDDVRAVAEERLGYEVDVRGTPTAGEVFEVTAADSRARRAAAGANAFAAAYLEVRGDDLAGGLRGLMRATRDRIDALDVQIDRLEADQAFGPELNALHAERNGLSGQLVTFRGQADALRDSLGRVTSSATRPGAPASPDLARDLALGLAAGLLAGFGVALTRHLLDDRVRTRRQLEALLSGIPVLAVLPRFGRRDRGATGSVAVGAHRGLRAALDHARTAGAEVVVAVTSATSGDGTTTVVANLAVASAEAGDRTVAVDADLRGGELHRRLGVDPTPGLADVAGADELGPALQPAAGNPDLQVLARGAVAGNPAPLLAARRLLPVFGALRRNADLVLVDTPSTLGSSDAEALVGLVDGVVLVVPAGARTADVEEAVTALRRSGGRFLGAVLNRAEPDAVGYPARARGPAVAPPAETVPAPPRGSVSTPA